MSYDPKSHGPKSHGPESYGPVWDIAASVDGDGINTPVLPTVLPTVRLGVHDD